MDNADIKKLKGNIKFDIYHLIIVIFQMKGRHYQTLQTEHKKLHSHSQQRNTYSKKAKIMILCKNLHVISIFLIAAAGSFMLPVVESALLAFETSDGLKTLDASTGNLRALRIKKALLIEAVKSDTNDGDESA